MTLKRLQKSRQRNNSYSFELGGQLHKGDPKKPKQPGRDLTSFRFTSDKESTVERFITVYGDVYADAVRVVFYSNDIDNVVFPTRTEKWRGDNQLVWAGNGEVLTRWQNPDGTYTNYDPDNPQEGLEPRPQPEDKMAKDVGRLYFYMSGVNIMSRIRTTSLFDISYVYFTLHSYNEVLPNGIKGVPFILSRKDKKKLCPVPGDKTGKKAPRKLSLLTLQIDPGYLDANPYLYEVSVGEPDDSDINEDMSEYEPDYEQEIDQETGEITYQSGNVASAGTGQVTQAAKRVSEGVDLAIMRNALINGTFEKPRIGDFVTAWEAELGTDAAFEAAKKWMLDNGWPSKKAVTVKTLLSAAKAKELGAFLNELMNAGNDEPPF